MKLITYDFDGAPAVMHYLGAGTPEAIAAEICKAHGLDSPPKWREITKDEYAAIRAARPQPAKTGMPASMDSDDFLAAVRREMAMMGQAILNLDSKLDAEGKRLDGKIETAVDLIQRTDIEGGS